MEYHVVYICGQGYGYMDASNYDAAMEFAPARVTLIASFVTETQAREAYSQLPQEWRDIEGLHYSNGEWWRATGLSAATPEGRLELFAPADRRIPVVRLMRRPRRNRLPIGQKEVAIETLYLTE